MPSDPIAYFITFRTYGNWLHGDARGSVDREHNTPSTPMLPADPSREASARNRSGQAPFALSDDQRNAVEAAIRDVCKHKGWELHALNVRTNHVHAVASALDKPEKVLHAFKAWASRRMKESRLIDEDAKPWSRHGSTRYLWKPEQVDVACRYVLEAQDDPR